MTYQIPRETLDLINRRPFYLEEESGDSRCHACLGVNPIWWVHPNAVWNEVMDDEGGILCPTCFMIVAQARGVLVKGAAFQVSVSR